MKMRCFAKKPGKSKKRSCQGEVHLDLKDKEIINVEHLIACEHDEFDHTKLISTIISKL